MTALPAATATLLLISGIVKLRAWARVSQGIHLVPLLEIVAGLLMGAAVMTGTPDPGVGLALTVGAVSLVVVSSVVVGRQIRHLHRARERSEGARLVTWVKYLSQPPNGG
jgi:hypothetical protein